MLIGVIVCGIVEDYAINLIKGIEQMSENNDVKCVIIPVKFLGADYENILRNKYAYCYNSSTAYGLLSCFDGLIIEMASVLTYADDTIKEYYADIFDGIPHVFVSFDRDNVSNVAIDNQAGLMDALEYMYANGARKYAMLGGTPNNVDSILRKTCFEEFIRKYDLPYNEKSYQDGNFFRSCDKEADQLVRDNMDADVFVCANDVLAKIIYKSLRQYGRRPGKDVSVLGFDDSVICTATYPSISSVRTDVIEVGKASCELLMDVIKKKSVRKTTIPSKFILRDSICHRAPVNEEQFSGHKFDDFVMSNMRDANSKQLDVIRTRFLELSELVDNRASTDFNTLLDNIYLKLDDLFSSEGLDCIDWERLSEVINIKYADWIKALPDINERQKLTDLYIKFYEFIMMASHNSSPDKIYADIMRNMGMEMFLREAMQYVRSAEANYTRFISNVDFLGIKNAFLYLYDEPIYYIQGEQLEIPKYLNLKAVLRNGEANALAQNKQRIKKEAIFDNKYVTWSDYSRLTLFPVCSDNILYGVLLCDIKQEGYEQADLFMNQIGSGIHMMNLRIENRRIVDDYEESVRKLKEYNITLDNMSKTDSLTGLNNRRGFYTRANTLLELLPNESMSVVVGYADMNDLKLVNDRFGHDDGDHSLKTIGNLITDFVTEYSGFCARIGGDEFAYIIVVPKGSEIGKYREELYSLFAEFNRMSGKPYNIEVSVGDYLLEEGMKMTLEDALHQADERLYFEKSISKKKGILKDFVIINRDRVYNGIDE